MLETWEAAYVAGIIDGEGSITLTRMHESENRRPCITIASTDIELLLYIQHLIGGTITNKKNYYLARHKDSFTLNVKNKDSVLSILKQISHFLRVEKKRKRALWILENYENVTPRNGKYSKPLLEKKILFEELFFKI